MSRCSGTLFTPESGEELWELLKIDDERILLKWELGLTLESGEELWDLLFLYIKSIHIVRLHSCSGTVASLGGIPEAKIAVEVRILRKS